MNKKISVEICCGSADDVVQAALAGASRVELNSAMLLGGLTPSVGTLIAVQDELQLWHDSEKNFNLPEIFTMIRPREGGFCYSDLEFKSMLEDIEKLIEHGTDGIVFGILHADGSVDQRRCLKILRMIDPLPAVFHRAIDTVPDWRGSMDSLIDLGFKRILTSGQAKSAFEGRETIRQMREHARGRIEILPAGGISPDNVIELLAFTACDQIHLSMMKRCIDDSISANENIRFGSQLPASESFYSLADREKIAAIVHQVNS